MPRRLEDNNRPPLDRNSRIVNTQQLLSLLGFILSASLQWIHQHTQQHKQGTTIRCQTAQGEAIQAKNKNTILRSKTNHKWKMDPNTQRYLSYMGQRSDENC